MEACRKGLSADFLCCPQGGFIRTRSPTQSGSSTTSSTSQRKTRERADRLCASSPSSIASAAAGSTSTKTARGAPRSSAPMPSMPFPAPRSTTPLSMLANGSWALIPNSHKAAISPSVAYCSNLTFFDGWLGSPESSIAKCFCFHSAPAALRVRLRKPCCRVLMPTNQVNTAARHEVKKVSEPLCASRVGDGGDAATCQPCDSSRVREFAGTLCIGGQIHE
mmetsp:Transcript_33967/g.79089  ORF Transcript_33967/g.79089 Transcript_33967/m.79089 type:complete len:221 (+) Transcript_33967:252-914(+)